jgi:hypothetical protein
MAPILVVVGLLMLGVAIVAWATRRTTSRSYVKRRVRDTAGNDPMTVATLKPKPTRMTGSMLEPQPEAFAAAPVSTPQAVSPAPFRSLVLAHSTASDPFAHAPSLSDLDRAPLEMRQ